MLLFQIGQMHVTMTLILIVVTCIVSYLAEEDRYMKDRYLYSPYLIERRQEYYRFITGGFVHSGYIHLAFNMIVLYSFGQYVEYKLQQVFMHEELGSLAFAVFYLSGIAIAGLPAYLKHRGNMLYKAVGASGAVSAVVFVTIILYPLNRLSVFFIPMPAFIFGFLYVFYSYYMARRGQDNIGHDAHLFGAIYGVIFIVALQPNAIFSFIDQITHWRFPGF